MNIHRRRIHPVLIWAVGGLILLVVFLANCSRPPNPQSRRLVADRQDMGIAVDGALAEVVGIFDGGVLATSHVDACYVGQRNYKVDTGYKHRCSIRTSVLLGLDGDFRSRMLSFDDSLRERNWSGSEFFGELVDEYWELRVSESPDGVVDIGRLPTPRGVRRGDLSLDLVYASFDNTLDLERMSRQQEITWGFGPLTYENADLFDIPAVLIGRSFEHVVLVIVEGIYYSRA